VLKAQADIVKWEVFGREKTCRVKKVSDGFGLYRASPNKSHHGESHQRHEPKGVKSECAFDQE
jgi:hypothetical protein